jgi:hypothetical protein
MPVPNPRPTSFQVRFSNAKTTTESYRVGRRPGLPHVDTGRLVELPVVAPAPDDVDEDAVVRDELDELDEPDEPHAVATSIATTSPAIDR